MACSWRRGFEADGGVGLRLIGGGEQGSFDDVMDEDELSFVGQ